MPATCVIVVHVGMFIVERTCTYVVYVHGLCPKCVVCVVEQYAVDDDMYDDVIQDDPARPVSMM